MRADILMPTRRPAGDFAAHRRRGAAARAGTLHRGRRAGNPLRAAAAVRHASRMFDPSRAHARASSGRGTGRRHNRGVAAACALRGVARHALRRTPAQ